MRRRPRWRGSERLVGRFDRNCIGRVHAYRGLPMGHPPRIAEILENREIRAGVHTGMPFVWEVSDEALLAGYVSGDRAAASLFVQRFQRQMIGLARVMT